jgi:deoxyribodipyrimidine photolyase
VRLALGEGKLTASGSFADVHHPPEKVADKLGYPRPIVKHEEARQRALRRYKSPGEA